MSENLADFLPAQSLAKNVSLNNKITIHNNLIITLFRSLILILKTLQPIMTKYYYIILSVIFFINCSKNEPINEIKEEEEKEIINLPPDKFKIVTNKITYNTATINWEKALDPENDSITYTIYLNNELVVENLTTINYNFTDLAELTSYSGKVIAIDTNNNKTEINFTFTTPKYFLKYLKKYNYGKVDYGFTGYAHGAASSMIKTSDDNYLITGTASFPNGSGTRFFIIKIDYEGNELWKKFYDYLLEDNFNFKIVETLNSYTLVGHHHVINIDNNGDLVWYKKIESYDIEDGAAQIKSVVSDSANNLYLVGGRGSNNPKINQEAVITKLNSSGEILWEKTYTPSSRNYFNDIKITDNNQLIIIGSVEGIYNNSISTGYRIIKTNTNGDIIWENSFRFGYHGVPHQIIITKRGNYAFVGYKEIIEVSEDGSNIKTYPNFITNPSSLAQTNDGGYIVTGNHYPPYADFNMIGIAKYDLNGNIEWEKIIQEPYTYMDGKTILVENDGGYRICGSSSKYYYDNDERPYLLIYKTDNKGSYEY